MRGIRMHALLLLLLVYCWLATTASAGDVDVSVSVDATPDPKPSPTPERKGRIKAPDGTDRVLATQDQASTTAVQGAAASTAATTAGGTPAVGLAPVVVLATGSVVIAAVALAFQRRRTAGKNERDASDPMQQSLLFHDMDYAAM